jgi:hypothetical protein
MVLMRVDQTTPEEVPEEHWAAIEEIHLRQGRERLSSSLQSLSELHPWSGLDQTDRALLCPLFEKISVVRRADTMY